MKLENGKYQVELKLDLDYNPDSKDNRFDYEKNYLTDSDYILPTKIGITLYENEVRLVSAIIGAEGGATGLHGTSQIFEENRIVICCCDSVFCLEIPTLNLLWKTKVDFATAFQIFEIKDGYVIHGEMEISRIDYDGKIIWQQGGADIFVTQDGENDFDIKDSIIIAKDWNYQIYRWNLDGLVIE